MRTLGWYLRRISVTSPMEVGYRAKGVLRKRIEKAKNRDFREFPKLISDKYSWYFDIKGNKEETLSCLKGLGVWTENKAEDLTKHIFSFFSFDKKYFGEQIDWHSDYNNHSAPPLVFSSDIDYQNISQNGDFKYIWEINRHQHLVSLAKAFYLTRDPVYKDEVVKQISDWIDKNPYMKGINWTSPLELGIRLISWSWAWAFLREEIDPGFKGLWLNAIYKHCLRISHNFSRYSSANNHLVGEAAGLFIASIVWPFEKVAQFWQKKSKGILEAEIQKQISDDGVDKEQAIAYQHFVMDFFILAGLLGEKNAVQFSRNYWDKIEKMTEFVASIMDEGGNVPSFGDSDNGFAATLSEDTDYNPYRSLLTSGVVLFDRKDLKSRVRQFDERNFWLFGAEGVRKFHGFSEETFVPKKCFADGGYYILSLDDNLADELKCIFDCGPLGYLNIAAHGHADALSVTLSVKGNPVLIDPGTYIYQYPKEWRDYFKGTSAHNTVRIDKKDQSVIGGHYMWLKKAKTKLLEWDDEELSGSAVGEQYGYASLRERIVHRRSIRLDKRYKTLDINDRIEATQSHLIEQYFHFSERCSFEHISPSQWRIRINGTDILFDFDQTMDSRLYSGSVDPIAGWRSRTFDIKEKCFTIINQVNIKGNGLFRTHIQIV